LSVYILYLVVCLHNRSIEKNEKEWKRRENIGGHFRRSKQTRVARNDSCPFKRPDGDDDEMWFYFLFLAEEDPGTTHFILASSLLWILIGTLLQTYDGVNISLCECSHVDLESISIARSGWTSTSHHLVDSRDLWLWSTF
jgi:hypothetical protein